MWVKGEKMVNFNYDILYFVIVILLIFLVLYFLDNKLPSEEEIYKEKLRNFQLKDAKKINYKFFSVIVDGNERYFGYKGMGGIDPIVWIIEVGCILNKYERVKLLGQISSYEDDTDNIKAAIESYLDKNDLEFNKIYL